MNMTWLLALTDFTSLKVQSVSSSNGMAFIATFMYFPFSGITVLADMLKTG